MMPRSFAEKHYSSARSRYLQGALEEFLERELSNHFGPIIRQKLVDEILRLLEAVNRSSTDLQPGECLWRAVSLEHRADHPERSFREVILSLSTQEDAEALAHGVPMRKIAGWAIARIMRQAYEQGALLSMRDIELLTWRSSGNLTRHRQAYEQEHDCVLPHTGTLHDMGSCLTHKEVIVRKVVQQKLSVSEVSRQTNHTVAAIDRYLGDYRRVQHCYRSNYDVEQITLVTGIAPFVVRQYITLHESLENQQ